MNDKIRETIKQAQEALEQANKALSDVMQELDEEELDEEQLGQVAGAGDEDPYADYPRVPVDPLPDDR